MVTTVVVVFEQGALQDKSAFKLLFILFLFLFEKLKSVFKFFGEYGFL